MASEQFLEKLKPVVQTVAQALYQWRRRAASVGLCLVAGWVAYHVIFGANGTMVYSQKIAEHRTLNKQIVELKQENERLAHQVNALKNDPKTIEKEAREQLRYARPGEVIYTLPQRVSPASNATAQNR